jgi:hypothetical protein
MEFRTCTAQLPDFSFCTEPSVPDAPFPICFRHASAVYEFLRGRIDAAGQSNWLDDRASALIASSVQRPRQDHDNRGAVYYVKLGDLLKIGCTYRRVWDRVSSYPPHRVLLAAEPGGFEVEAQRLAQFAHLKVSGKEWHDFGPDLREHVAAIRELHGVPQSQPNWMPAGSGDGSDLYTVLSARNADAAADETLKSAPQIGSPEMDALVEELLRAEGQAS